MACQVVVDYLVYFVVRVLICLIQATRLETGARASQFLAWLFTDVLRIRGKVVEENLAHAFPGYSESQRRDLARRMWHHLFLMVVEIAHAPRKIHETNWRRYFTLRGEEMLLRYSMAARPTLLVTAHFGNFELAGYGLGLLGFPNHAIARTLDNPFLNRFVNRFRSATGQYIIPKNGGYDQILAVLAQGGVLTFLADQAAGKKGCWVQFFGRPASAHKAIALLGLENGAPMVVSYARRLDQPLHFELATYAKLDLADLPPEMRSVPDLTQWFTTRLEEIVQMAPEQYWWVHRRWKDNRSASQRRRAA